MCERESIHSKLNWREWPSWDQRAKFFATHLTELFVHSDEQMSQKGIVWQVVDPGAIHILDIFTKFFECFNTLVADNKSPGYSQLVQSRRYKATNVFCHFVFGTAVSSFMGGKYLKKREGQKREVKCYYILCWYCAFCWGEGAHRRGYVWCGDLYASYSTST